MAKKWRKPFATWLFKPISSFSKDDEYPKPFIRIPLSPQNNILIKQFFFVLHTNGYQLLIFVYFIFFSGVDPWAHLELPVNIWIIIVGSVIAFWFFLSCCLATCCGPRNIECHLCEEPIRKRKWTKSGHWDQCAQDHARFLNELPDTEYPCPS